MDFMNLLATAPSGVWESLIMWIESWAGTYILSIILLTVVIKILWSPFDFFNRKITSKQTAMTNKLKPEIDKIQKKYANDKAAQNQKLGELYKKNNFNMVGGCLFMLVFIGLNMFIFFSLFAGLGNMSQYKITQQYDDLKYSYANELSVELYGTSLETYTNEQINEMIGLISEDAHAEIIVKIQSEYEDSQEYFLWIGNIWKSEVPWTNSVPTFDEYANIAKLNDEQRSQERAIYESFMNPIRDEIGRPNGFLICAILAIGTAFLSTWLTTKKNKGAPAAPGTAGTNKVMMFLMPGLMGVFALTTNSVFAIYMIVGQLVTIALTPLVNLLINKTIKTEELKKKDEIVVEYSRNNQKEKEVFVDNKRKKK